MNHAPLDYTPTAAWLRRLRDEGPLPGASTHSWLSWRAQTWGWVNHCKGSWLLSRKGRQALEIYERLHEGAER